MILTIPFYRDFFLINGLKSGKSLNILMPGPKIIMRFLLPMDNIKKLKM